MLQSRWVRIGTYRREIEIDESRGGERERRREKEEGRREQRK